ncbi:hypothetical protein H7142_02620 [Candidatus Saccharibacteria bacterium]|nr:hypothetical protein [Candidatus Saccharibacteria bacterium]
MSTIQKNGFTVVELLVIVVVIVLLATIGTASYRGLVTRANNADIAETVSKYIDALVIYHSKNGKYPDGNANYKTCLGVGYPGGTCWAGEVSQNAAFSTSLSSFTSPVLSNGSLSLRGAYFNAVGPSWNLTLDGVAENWVIYSVEGGSKCPVGPLASSGPGGVDDGNVFTYFSFTPPLGQTAPPGSGANAAAQCWVPLSLVK